MICPRCKVKMKDLSRTRHKQKKYACPVCGKIRMAPLKKKRKERTR